MLAAIMYHHINSDKYSNSVELFEKHLRYIKKRCTTVLPGEKLKAKRNICLTFDDAYFDFYYYVFPLLKKYRLKAVLAVPAKFILDDTKLSEHQRLGLPHKEMMKDGMYKTHVPFCTWTEIKEIQQSGFVEIASHGYGHIKPADETEINTELALSKQIIEKRLNCPCHTYIFPYGYTHEKLKTEAMIHYKYLFGIDFRKHNDWSGEQGIIYRWQGDDLHNAFHLIDEIYPKKNFFIFAA